MRILAGMYADAETGLYYWGARYYDPKIGRGTSPDRMGVAWHVQRYQANLGVPGQPPLEINPYVAVANNPLRWVDPTGLVSIGALPLSAFVLPTTRDVFLCRRPADIAAGLVDHYWVRTLARSAGLGGDPNVRPGDEYEAPYATKTYVVDHSKDKPTACEKMNNVDAPCVNDILSNEMGTYQGRFSGYMNCQGYAYSVVNRCRTGPQLLPAK